MVRCWLVCPHCGTKELVTDQTTGPCPKCGNGTRYAQGDNGDAMFVVSDLSDLTDWNLVEK